MWLVMELLAQGLLWAQAALSTQVLWLASTVD